MAAFGRNRPCGPAPAVAEPSNLPGFPLIRHGLPKPALGAPDRSDNAAAPACQRGPGEFGRIKDEDGGGMKKNKSTNCIARPAGRARTLTYLLISNFHSPAFTPPPSALHPSPSPDPLAKRPLKNTPAASHWSAAFSKSTCIGCTVRGVCTRPLRTFTSMVVLRNPGTFARGQPRFHLRTADIRPTAGWRPGAARP